MPKTSDVRGWKGERSSQPLFHPGTGLVGASVIGSVSDARWHCWYYIRDYQRPDGTLKVDLPSISAMVAAEPWKTAVWVQGEASDNGVVKAVAKTNLALTQALAIDLATEDAFANSEVFNEVNKGVLSGDRPAWEGIIGGVERLLGALAEVFTKLFSPAWWARVGVFTLGIVLAAVFIALIVKQTMGVSTQDIVKAVT